MYNSANITQNKCTRIRVHLFFRGNTMEFNSTAELLNSDPQSQAYFDSLPANVQPQLLDKYTGASNLDELRVFGDDLLTSI